MSLSEQYITVVGRLAQAGRISALAAQRAQRAAQRGQLTQALHQLRRRERIHELVHLMLANGSSQPARCQPAYSLRRGRTL